ncbi:electron transporter RnfD [Mucilaginibacter sp.]|uniref:electron transporter RnfD n=1 Tax=Mucilaginibacter sp. TaxID=1882438 RepID=UPI0025DEC0CE|nr:electron transporter RnfD [Mucilaginibacter sp.]
MKRYLRLVLISSLTIAVKSYGQVQIKVSNINISYAGRTKVAEDSVSLYWPGSAVTINFKGTGLNTTMQSFREKDYFYAIVDRDQTKIIKISSDSTKKRFIVASGLTDAIHSVEIYKLTNNTSETRFYGFEIEGKGKILPRSKAQVRKIEFYGNSITAGNGVDAPAGVQNPGAPEYFNNYYTYDALTARHFGAQCSCIARSGIGVMISGFPEIMPDIYDRLDPTNPQSKWNFSNYTPDIVVVNLFQYDYWLVKLPEKAQFKIRFGTTPPTDEFIIKSYQNFISTIRSKYPHASIICVLGNMNATEAGSNWPGYISQAVKNLNDQNIHTLFFPFKNTPGHPNRIEQQTMAKDLISFIDKNIKW